MLDLDFVRSNFPALNTPWALMDNAGGSVPCRQVIDGVRAHMERLPVQLGASYPMSVEAGEAVVAGRRAAAELLGASQEEIIFGISSTVLVMQLATALRKSWESGDEIIVTNLDHEANVGAWSKLAETGIVVKEWRVREDSLSLELEDLDELLTDRTRLVAFTHCSNVVGSIVDVAAIAKRVREAGALSCVDGVAFAPHRRVDVRALGVDFYFASLYKVYGPHIGAMFGRKQLLLETVSPNHFFVSEEAVPTKFEPGNVNYELAASLTGILEYFRSLGAHHGFGDELDLDKCFGLIAEHEEQLVEPLLSFLREHPKVQLVGAESASPQQRVPTVSFTVEGRSSSEICPLLDEHQVAVRFGHFYAYRLIQSLDLMERDGVVRASLAHYNSPGEVTRLIDSLELVL